MQQITREYPQMKPCFEYFKPDGFEIVTNQLYW